QPYDNSDYNHASGASDNKAENVASCGAERLSYPKIPQALLDRVREDAEQPHHGQQERQPGECHHKRRAKSVASRGFPGNIFERHHISDTHQLSFVNASDRRTYGSGQRFAASRYRPDDHEHVTHWILSQWNVDLNKVLCFIRTALYLADNTHYFAYHGRRRLRFRLSDGEPHADCLPAADVAAHESFIHQAHGHTIPLIAIIERPAGHDGNVECPKIRRVDDLIISGRGSIF